MFDARTLNTSEPDVSKIEMPDVGAQGRTFFRQWLRNPREVGAIFPSSSSLANAMAAQIEMSDDGTVIELGAGTGVITKALLETGIRSSRLLIVEKNPAMVNALRQRFAGLCIVQNDVTRLSRIVREQGNMRNIKSIVSGLPMLLFDRPKQYAILRQAFSVLAAGGSFIQFTYGPKQPVSRHVLARLGIKATRITIVWHNTPPAVVWRLEVSPAAIMHEH